MRATIGRPNKVPWVLNGWYPDTPWLFFGSDGDPETGELYHCTLAVWAGRGRRIIIPIPRFVHYCADADDAIPPTS
jgi:hypothetical protein